MIGYFEMYDILVMGYEVLELKFYSYEVEYVVIGVMIQKGDLIEDMGVKLEVLDFYYFVCVELFELLLVCQVKGIVVDIVIFYEVWV